MMSEIGKPPAVAGGLPVPILGGRPGGQYGAFGRI